jgi:hypothetical protein
MKYLFLPSSLPFAFETKKRGKAEAEAEAEEVVGRTESVG